MDPVTLALSKKYTDANIRDGDGAPLSDVVAARSVADAAKATADAAAPSARLATGPLLDPTQSDVLSEAGGDTIPLDVIDGSLVGRNSNTLRVWNGSTWETLATLPSGPTPTTVRRAGAEVIASRREEGLWRSSGWDADSTTATWSKVLAVTASDCEILPWGLDTHEDIVLACEYAVGPRTNSRRAWVSTDAGANFTEVLDLDAEFPGQETLVHWHAAAIDPWTGRLWLSNGDGPKALWRSENTGASWTRHDESNIADVTVIVAAEHGILLGSDAVPDGVFRIGRKSGTPPAPESIYRITTSAQTMSHVAQRGYRTPSGTAYIAFAALTGYHGEVVASQDGRRVDRVWRDPTEAASDNRGPRSVLAHDDGLTVRLLHAAGTTTVTGDEPLAGTSVREFDHGNVLGGDAGSIFENPSLRNVAVGPGSRASGGTGTAVGWSSIASGTARSIAIGFAAKASESYTIGIGGDVEANATNQVLIGRNIISSVPSVVAIGADALASQAGNVAVGDAAEATGIRAVAVGRQSAAVNDGVAVGNAAKTTQSQSVAIGYTATATALYGTALGRGATAGHNYAVALGHDSVSTAVSQVQIAARHIEVSEVTEPAAPGADRARLYVKDNGSGKTELCVRFPTGAVQVLATEP